ncbi:DUF1349 domain-containing protein [Rhizobium wenxiniae]|nr:DUF1349 domain-containing protein [Rhizobium wenxiniae]
MGMDHLTIVDIVGVAGDFLDEFEAFAGQHSDVADRVDMRRVTAQVRVQAHFEHLYDQAGLMVRLDERRWVKTGIEFSDGYGLLGSVLTDGVSDWATGRYEGNPSDFWIRVTVQSGVLRIQASGDGQIWPLVRLCPFPEANRYLVGPMCCTPERAGLKVRFSEWRLGQALGKDLHDLT